MTTMDSNTTDEPPFSSLQPFTPRSFVPQDIDLGDWSQIEPLFDQLVEEAALLAKTAELERWLLRASELNAAISEEGNRRYVAMTCDTASETKEAAYLEFVEKVEPPLKLCQFKLKQIYSLHPLRKELSRDRYCVYNREVEVDLKLFREENVPLETEETRIGQRYQKLSGGLTVEFRGEERTLVQMGRFLEESDRSTREEAWRAISGKRLEHADGFDAIFGELLAVREKIASNAGFGNYRDYMFQAMHRFDYTPEDCGQFHKAIEEIIMPLVVERQRERKAAAKLDSVRPWDLSMDPDGRPPLAPFQKVDDLVAKTGEIFLKVDHSLAREFEVLDRTRLLDLDNRKGKAPGGYQTNLEESRLPFIFMNAVGVQRDVETLLHEAGHAFHALAAREEDFLPYRSAPIEFCEVASMSMELLGNEFISEFYESEDAVRARRTHLEGVLDIFPWIATVDAFQHWIYTNPGHSTAERDAAWTDLMKRFGGEVDWSGFENNRAKMWHKQLHIFLCPFYYIEYGIAQLGALQVWRNWKADPAKALDQYKSALALGGSRPLPVLFEAAGCGFRFDAESIAPLADLIRSELATME